MNDEDAIICDLAETYHILDYESLSPLLVATLICGLRDNSRIKQKLSGSKQDTQTILLAMLLDRFTMANFNKDGVNLIAPKFFEEEKKESEVISFETVDDYKKAIAEFDNARKE